MQRYELFLIYIIFWSKMLKNMEKIGGDGCLMLKSRPSGTQVVFSLSPDCTSFSLGLLRFSLSEAVDSLYASFRIIKILKC